MVTWSGHAVLVTLGFFAAAVGTAAGQDHDRPLLSGSSEPCARGELWRAGAPEEERLSDDDSAVLRFEDAVRHRLGTEAGSPPHSIGLFVILSACGGFFSSTGANVLAWSAHKTRTTGKEWTKRQETFFYVFCFLFNLIGIGLFALSTMLGGAVATVMPIQTGASLLGNMSWQIVLGIKVYSKSMRVGTLVLLCAVAELSELGPIEPTKPDVLTLLSQQVAIMWCVFLVACTGVMMFGCYRTYREPVDSPSKLVCFTLGVTIPTVIGGSMGKCFTILTGMNLAIVMVLYFVDGIIVMGLTVLANAKTDVSVFIPAQLSSQLIFNMITGYLVWDDSKYIEKPVSYILVYLLCILGVYLVSPDLDLVGEVFRYRQARRSKLSEGVACDQFGEAALALLGVWRRQGGRAVPESAAEREACRQALTAALQLGQETGSIKSHEVIALVMCLLQERGYGPSAPLVQWLEELQQFRS
ncbi:unnamed protein product [Polarella glacialis]|uniref:Magnesium transporter n=1 Tax=Polarella glacialis TaxID=89957 RepID=A0A813GN45_POLGL|nr:unnamed protein product [Polarella glacialis]